MQARAQQRGRADACRRCNEPRAPLLPANPGDPFPERAAQQLPGRAADFNAFLDAVESDLSLSLSESTPGALVQAVTQRLQRIEQEAGLDFAAWNSALLGISAPNEAVFQATLARGALAGGSRLEPPF